MPPRPWTLVAFGSVERFAHPRILARVNKAKTRTQARGRPEVARAAGVHSGARVAVGVRTVREMSG